MKFYPSVKKCEISVESLNDMEKLQLFVKIENINNDKVNLKKELSKW